MADINVDINETEIFNLYPEVLDTLLKDHTTGRNIFWATDSYAHRGDGFQYSDTITVEHIIGENGMVIRPRALKSKDEQTERTKEMAEVFTPSWVCNQIDTLLFLIRSKDSILLFGYQLGRIYFVLLPLARVSLSDKIKSTRQFSRIIIPSYFSCDICVAPQSVHHYSRSKEQWQTVTDPPVAGTTTECHLRSI